MVIPFSCPLANYVDLENGLESLLEKSVNLEDDKIKTLLRFISSNHGDSDIRTMKPEGNEKMVMEEITESLSNPEYNAAVKLQKVYKSFRTRRKLADCAVLIEQRWWKLLDFAELKHSSISFFDGEKQETAVSRWARAGTRAAKVGKGLSKNNKGQKLALQHWLEAIDPRHRYGHNLHFYYKEWLNSQSREPFFYWLDIGEGKEKDHVKCSRSKLQQQCIKYLGPMERKAYEISLENGKFFYKQSGEPLHTIDEPDLKWIFVLSTSKIIYAGKKKKGSFQHSSFLAGGAALAAGRLEVDNGTLKAVWPHSGHYRPTEESFKDFLSFLEENNIDLTNVQLSPAVEDETSHRNQDSMFLRNSSSEGDLTKKVETAEDEKTDFAAKEFSIDANARRICKFARNLSNLDIPPKSESFEKFNIDPESPLGCYKAAKETFEIEPRKKLKTLQIGKQLSCIWTTGAGPRIGFVRDSPTQLQVRALEHVNLSPRIECGLSKPMSTIKKDEFFYPMPIQLLTAKGKLSKSYTKCISLGRLIQ